MHELVARDGAIAVQIELLESREQAFLGGHLGGVAFATAPVTINSYSFVAPLSATLVSPAAAWLTVYRRLQ